MQLIRSAESQDGFNNACAAYENYDERYKQRDVVEGIFTNDFIEYAYLAYLILKQADEDSAAKKSFNIWRDFYCEKPKNLSVFFMYVEHLFSAAVSYVWLNKWDSKDRNISKERELICRIFILGGLTAKEKFYSSGALT